MKLCPLDLTWLFRSRNGQARMLQAALCGCAHRDRAGLLHAAMLCASQHRGSDVRAKLPAADHMVTWTFACSRLVRLH